MKKPFLNRLVTPLLRATNRTAYNATTVLERARAITPQNARKIRSAIIVQDLTDSGRLPAPNGRYALRAALPPELETTRRIKQRAKKERLVDYNERLDRYMPVSTREEWKQRPRMSASRIESDFWKATDTEQKLARSYRTARNHALAASTLIPAIIAGGVAYNTRKKP